MLQDTSIQAHESILADLSERQRKVRLALLKFGPMTNEQIAVRLEWPINVVTPRVLELREMGVVQEAGYATSEKTGRKAHVWKLTYTPPAPSKPVNQLTLA